MAERYKRIRKKELRGRLSELRKLWNEYDPIGVVEDSDIDDEYDAYVGPHLNLLERGATDTEIFEHIKGKVTGYMGMTWSQHLSAITQLFVLRSREWFDKSPRTKLH
jgi:hypothetical protein